MTITNVRPGTRFKVYSRGVDVSDLAGYQPLAEVLTNTTASFTTAHVAKLGGVDMLIGGARERPGESKAAASEELTGAAADRDAFTAGTIVASDYFGAVLQIDGSEIGSDGYIDVAQRIDCPIEVGHKYAVRWAMERAEDPLDPANEAVELRLQNLDKDKAAISNVVLGLNSGEFYELVEADGPLDVTMRIAREEADDVDYVVPDGTRYVTVLARLYGSTGKTNIAVLDCTDITLATVVSEGATAGLAAEIAARIAGDLAKPNGAFLLNSVGGTSTAYTATSSPDSLTSYTAGQTVWFVPNQTSGAAPTLNINSLGAVAIRDRDDIALPTGMLISGRRYLLYYDGTRFRVVNATLQPEGAITLASVGGTSTAFTATSPSPLTALTSGMSFWFTPNANSGAAPTLNINSIGAAAIRDRDGTALFANALVSGRDYLLHYNGTHFRLGSDFRNLLGPILLTSVAGGATAYTASAVSGAYETGQELLFTPNVDSAASPTINVNSQGARSIRDHTGTALSAGALVAGTQYVLVYDGTLFRVVSYGIFSSFRWLSSVAGDSTPYTATSAYVSLTSGQGVWLTPNVDNESSPSLNINGTGSKSIRDRSGGTLPANVLIAGQTYGLVYDGTVFRMLDDTIVGDQNFNIGAVIGSNMFWGWHEAEQRLYLPPVDLELADARNKAHRENVRSRGVQPDVASVIIGGVNIIAGIGQSKMVGAQGGPAIDRTPITGNFMLGGQERSITKNHVFTPYTGSAQTLEPLIATVEEDDFAPMSEANQDNLTYGEGRAGQTSLVSAVNGFRVLFDIANGSNDPETWCVAINLGIGGASADELRKSHTQGSVEYYTQYTSALDQIKTIADSEGKACQVLAILRSQGETDELGGGLSTNGAEFEAVVGQDITDRQEDAVDHGGNALIHPALSDVYKNRVKPAYFTTIPGEGYARDDDPSGTPDSMVANAYQRLARSNAGRYFILGPDYPYTNIAGLHHDANGYRWRGLKWAQIMYRVLKLREDWEPCWVLKTELKDDIAYVHCNVPVGKLQVGDPYQDGELATLGLQAGGVDVLGFRVMDAGLLIAIEATLVADTVIRLDLSRVPYSPEGIYYAPEAYQGNGWLCDEDAMDPLWDFEELAGMFNLPAELVNERYDMRNYLCPGYFSFNQDFTA